MKKRRPRVAQGTPATKPAASPVALAVQASTRLHFLPLVPIVALALFGLVPHIQSTPTLLSSVGGATALLAIWWAMLWMGGRPRNLAIALGLYDRPPRDPTEHVPRRVLVLLPVVLFSHAESVVRAEARAGHYPSRMGSAATLLIWFQLRSPELAEDFERLMTGDRDLVRGSLDTVSEWRLTRPADVPGQSLGQADYVLIAEIIGVERLEQQASEHIQRLADDLAHLVSSRGMLIVRPVL
jgi:hypothetical protein